MTRTRTAGLALLLAALLLAGCGGGGDGEPTVTQTLHDELQAELDAALADLEKERKAKADEEAARETAEGEVTRLEGELDTAVGRVTQLTTQLATTTDSVTDLTGELETATANVTRLGGELGTARENVTRLEGEIGSADDPADADADASLHAQLNAANAEVTRLKTLVGAATDPANADGSLHAQLNAATAKVTDLTGKLTTAEAKVTELEGEIGSTGEAASLKGKLETANTKVTRLTAELEVANTSLLTLRGQLTTAQQQAQQAQQQAQQAQQQAQQQTQQVQQRAQAREASQRADNLKSVLGMSSAVMPDTLVTLTVLTQNTLRATRNGYSPATPSSVSGTGMRRATLSLQSTGDTGKTVVYTDIELDRSLVGHYRGPEETRLPLNVQVSDLAATPSTEMLVGDTIPQTSQFWKILHGFRTRIAGTMADEAKEVDDPDEKSTSSYGGSLHGVSGRYVCTGTSCRVQVAPTYSAGFWRISIRQRAAVCDAQFCQRPGRRN